ncbi:uncharacterized protein LOC127526734 [Erpetoichthys calabaricus]|uniref:uncharacterized protein LOC127526734 n=1 Tax=Erpetoichthys calabaricus TaxID=27687 RepID=UPI002234B045|nr:uncharacterized protein LOC127526734 [Erpetoichthys calabaricus]
MCRLFEEYKDVNDDNTLPQLISLFAPFPNKVPLSDIDNEEYSFHFSFLSQCHPDKVAVPQHKEAYQDLRRCVLNSLWEAVRKKRISYTLYYKCMADFGDQKDFNESLRLTNNEVHVNPNWTEETLKTISNFIKCSSSKPDILLDDDDDNDWYISERERFVQFLSDCLDGISSIRNVYKPELVHGEHWLKALGGVKCWCAGSLLFCFQSSHWEDFINQKTPDGKVYCAPSWTGRCWID